MVMPFIGALRADFLNREYYLKGLLKLETMADAGGNKYLETENTYELRDVLAGGILSDASHLTATGFQPHPHR